MCCSVLVLVDAFLLVFVQTTAKAELWWRKWLQLHGHSSIPFGVFPLICRSVIEPKGKICSSNVPDTFPSLSPQTYPQHTVFNYPQYSTQNIFNEMHCHVLALEATKYRHELS